MILYCSRMMFLNAAHMYHGVMFYWVMFLNAHDNILLMCLIIVYMFIVYMFIVYMFNYCLYIYMFIY